MVILIVMLFNQSTSLDEIISLQKEIQIVNLINGLELSTAQMKYIITKVHELNDIQDTFHTIVEANKGTICHTLNDLKTCRMDDQEIPQDLIRSVHKVEEELRVSRMVYIEATERIVKEIHGIFTGNQIYQLENYIPCLIPPPGDAKIGQSDKSVGIINHLVRLRKIPSHVYDRKKQDIVERVLEKIKTHRISSSDFNEEQERVRLLDLIDEIRNVDDVTFELNKETYAKELKGEVVNNNAMPDVSHKIERFFLDPAIIPLLEKKITVY